MVKNRFFRVALLNYAKGTIIRGSSSSTKENMLTYDLSRSVKDHHDDCISIFSGMVEENALRGVSFFDLSIPDASPTPIA